METTVKLLQTYAGRDKIMRTTTYVCMLLAGKLNGKSAQDFGVIAKQIGSARTVGRLFDDLLMLAFSHGYGMGKHERDPVTRCLQILTNVANQLYFPIEHVAWAMDNKIVTSGESGPWWKAGIGCWASSLFLSILKSFRTVGRVRHKRRQLIKQQKLESPEKSGEGEKSFKQSMRDLKEQEFTELLNIVKNGSDLMNAVSWLPPGFLWAGKLSVAQNGIFGSISSFIGLYQLVQTQAKAKAA